MEYGSTKFMKYKSYIITNPSDSGGSEKTHHFPMLLPVFQQIICNLNIKSYVFNGNKISILFLLDPLIPAICCPLNTWTWLELNDRGATPNGTRPLTHWGRDKMVAVSQTTLSNAFSWMKMLELRLKFHWSLFLWVQFTIIQHWFR